MGCATSFVIGIWDVPLLSNGELVERGLPVHEVVDRRIEHAGHRRPISTKWARSVGCWGGVESVPDIAGITGKTKAQVWSWAQKRGVRSRTNEREHSHAQLAAGLYFDRARLSTEESRERWSVLPIERVILLACFEEVLVQAEAAPEAALDWSPVELEERWQEAEVGVAPPWD